MEIQAGGGVFGLGNLGGRGGHSDLGNPSGRGGQKTLPSVGGVWIFSGITHFCMSYFSKMKNKTAEKITRQCFPVKCKVACKNLAHLEGKKSA